MRFTNFVGFYNFYYKGIEFSRESGDMSLQQYPAIILIKQLYLYITTVVKLCLVAFI